MILRRARDQVDLAKLVLQVALVALADFPELVAQNRRMLDLYGRYVSDRGLIFIATRSPSP